MGGGSESVAGQPANDAAGRSRDYGEGGGSVNNVLTMTNLKEQVDLPYTKCNVTPEDSKPAKAPKVVEVILYKENLYMIPTDLLEFLDDYFAIKKSQGSSGQALKI